MQREEESEGLDATRDGSGQHVRPPALRHERQSSSRSARDSFSSSPGLILGLFGVLGGVLLGHHGLGLNGIHAHSLDAYADATDATGLCPHAATAARGTGEQGRVSLAATYEPRRRAFRAQRLGRYGVNGEALAATLGVDHIAVRLHVAVERTQMVGYTVLVAPA
jgi:hypothetical protein